MKPRHVRATVFALFAGAALVLAGSEREGRLGAGESIEAPSASLLIPAKTRLIISYSRRALA